MVAGRPQKPIDWELVEKKMEAHCTLEEIAGCCFVHPETMSNRIQEHYGQNFTVYSTNLRSVGKSKIRQTQLERALKGNTTMLTLLGQEWLGQGQQKLDAFVDETKQKLDILMDQMAQYQSLARKTPDNNINNEHQS